MTYVCVEVRVERMCVPWMCSLPGIEKTLANACLLLHQPFVPGLCWPLQQNHVCNPKVSGHREVVPAYIRDGCACDSS